MDILFVMNAQHSFLSSSGSVYMGEKAETLKVRLLDYISSYSGKKVFLREVHAMEDSFFRSDKTHSIATTSDCLICDSLRRFQAEYVDHNRYDAFYATNLENYLKRQKVKSVTVVGLETHTSILFTSESLRNRGYDVTIVEPCCMSRDDYMHAASISLMANFLGIAVSS